MEKKGSVGRPKGRTVQGEETRRLLYEAALALIGERGYEAATLREVAARVGVSVGLLYKYFSSKRAIVLALYDELSLDFVERASEVPTGPWRGRFLSSLRVSLDVLHPYRTALHALIPVLVGGEENLFSSATAGSRERVSGVFVDAVCGAEDVSEVSDPEALGRVLYFVHLGVLLWWLLDKSPLQIATERLLRSIEGAAPFADLLLGLPFFSEAITEADALTQSAFFQQSPRL